MIEVAHFFVRSILLRHGAPRVIVSVRGTSFASALFTHVPRLGETVHRKSTAYHPQPNGIVKWFSRTLEDIMSIYVTCDDANWDIVLLFVTFAYNSSAQQTTGHSTFPLSTVGMPLCHFTHCFHVSAMYLSMSSQHRSFLTPKRNASLRGSALRAHSNVA